MAEPERRYAIDTDALVHIQDMEDSERIYDEIIELVNAGQVKTVEQVFDELKRWEPVLEKFAPYKRNMLIADQYQEPTFSEAGYISENYELINEFSGHNPDPADPWLIAAAKTHGMTVVTDERRNSPKRIPHVCEERDVRCKSGPEFLAEVGIV